MDKKKNSVTKWVISFAVGVVVGILIGIYILGVEL